MKFPPSPDRPEIDRLFKAAASHRMTPREMWLQRVSFVYGNMSFSNPNVTREMVERTATDIYGPCPSEETENVGGVYCCLCGTETPCSYTDLNLARVFQCPACKEVRACVYPKGGGRAWIKVSPEDVEFYHLLGE